VRVVLAALTVLALAGCGAADRADEEVTGTVAVLADTSLTDVFTSLGQQLEADHPGLDVQFDFDDSGVLADRLTDGTAADVFASAGTDAMDVVTNNGIVSRAPALFATGEPDGDDLVGYPICTLTDAPNPAGALAFVQLVTSDAGQQALIAAGFARP